MSVEMQGHASVFIPRTISDKRSYFDVGFHQYDCTRSHRNSPSRIIRLGSIVSSNLPACVW